MRITDLKLQNVGPFKESVFHFQPVKDTQKAEIHILTGVNGSGKSSVLLALASAFKPEIVKDYFRFTDERSQLEITFDNLAAPIQIGYHTVTERKGHLDCDFAVLDYARPHLNVTASAFARQDQNIAAIARIENVVENMVGDKVRFIFNDQSLAVGIEINGAPLAFNVLSDGLKSIIGWLVDLMVSVDRLRWREAGDIFERNLILFLDKIDVHLHPAWQRKIVPVIQTLLPNAQIFMATYSPFVVASLEDAWVYKLAVADGYSSLASVVEAMAGYGYSTVLREIFGVDQQFDVETEREFKDFYDLKQKLLMGAGADEGRLIEIAGQLAGRSIETRDIVARELRQLERLWGRKFVG